MRGLHGPFLNRAQRALQLYFRLHKLEICIELVYETAALFDAGLLFVARCQRGRVGFAGPFCNCVSTASTFSCA